ncbi:hypothetical protein NX722_16615 [Endozoicomonas gorgoniicola]|uniref:GGDEF domain-containing protein n=1 Tax=Endozoicomonas gorgoniicola TaxID=1234144 RepID=A0ABT3MXV0_9GAMM|nr:hypothetical protein [Endozoicomonas gorgoniicola]MCW7554213.1 hypothetical protein [Endozoicomonas gorgoniicola]
MKKNTVLGLGETPNEFIELEKAFVELGVRLEVICDGDSLAAFARSGGFESLSLVLMAEPLSWVSIEQVCRVLDTGSRGVSVCVLMEAPDEKTIASRIEKGAEWVVPGLRPDRIPEHIRLLVRKAEAKRDQFLDVRRQLADSDRFQTLQSVMPPLCFTVDGMVVEFNPAFQKLFEIDDDFVSIVDLVDAGSRSDLITAMKSAVAEPVTMPDLVLPVSEAVWQVTVTASASGGEPALAMLFEQQGAQGDEVGVVQPPDSGRESLVPVVAGSRRDFRARLLEYSVSGHEFVLLYVCKPEFQAEFELDAELLDDALASLESEMITLGSVFHYLDGGYFITVDGELTDTVRQTVLGLCEAHSVVAGALASAVADSNTSSVGEIALAPIVIAAAKKAHENSSGFLEVQESDLKMAMTEQGDRVALAECSIDKGDIFPVYHPVVHLEGDGSRPLYIVHIAGSEGQVDVNEWLADPLTGGVIEEKMLEQVKGYAAAMTEVDFIMPLSESTLQQSAGVANILRFCTNIHPAIKASAVDWFVSRLDDLQHAVVSGVGEQWKAAPGCRYVLLPLSDGMESELSERISALATGQAVPVITGVADMAKASLCWKAKARYVQGAAFATERLAPDYSF